MEFIKFEKLAEMFVDTKGRYISLCYFHGIVFIPKFHVPIRSSLFKAFTEKTITRLLLKQHTVAGGAFTNWYLCIDDWKVHHLELSIPEYDILIAITEYNCKQFE